MLKGAGSIKDALNYYCIVIWFPNKACFKIVRAIYISFYG
jgi:hypothetical protein